MKISVWIPSILCLSLLAFGCGASDQDVLQQEGYSIELENGGFETGQDAPELAAFELDAEQVQTYVYTDDDGDEADAEAGLPEGRRVFVVRLAWGQFPFDPDVPRPTHWKGLVHAFGAKVFVQRAIFYERHDFFKPCRNRECVRIDSRTLPHHDGLILKIVPYGEDPLLLIGFEGSYGRIIPLAELDGLSDVARVDELGNKVVLDAFARPPCPAGLLGGVWKRLDERGGVFAGSWHDTEGLAAGKLTGIWGQRRDGLRVLFGIYADPAGRFIGLIRGTWTPAPSVGGVFFGRWVKADGSVGSVLRGRFGPHPAGVPKAVFHGRFQAACGHEPDLPPGPGPDCIAAGTCDANGDVLDGCTCQDDGEDLPDCSCQP